MLSYLNDPQLKTKFLAQLDWHRKADLLRKGIYGDADASDAVFRGCAVGCSLRSLKRLGKLDEYNEFDDHSLYEEHLGIPQWLAHLEDDIFEGLAPDASQEWPMRFSKAIPVGVDLQPIKAEFKEYLKYRLIARAIATTDEEVARRVIDTVNECFDLPEDAHQNTCIPVWEKARALFKSLVLDGRKPGLGSVVSAAVDVSRSYADSLATAVARAAEGALVGQDEYQVYADELIRLLSNCEA